MANTDPNDKNKKWTVQGFLNGVKSVFGLGGQRFILSPGTAAQQEKPNRLLAAARLQQGSQRRYASTRMQKAEDRLKLWNNDYESLLEEKLQANFHRENYARMRLMLHKSSNVMRRVIRDISLTYSEPPRRMLEIEMEVKPVIPSKLPTPPNDQPSDNTDVPPTDIPDVPPADNADVPVDPNGLNTGDPDIDALADILDLEGSDIQKDGPLQKLLKYAPLDATMETVEWFARFLPCVWVRPFVRYEDTLEEKDSEGNVTKKGDPATAKLDYIIYTPATADVVEDPENPTQAVAFFYWSEEFNEKGERQKFVNFFTSDMFFKLDTEWKVVQSEPNPLGIPVVPMRLGKPHNSYFLDGEGDDLFEGTLEIGVLRTIQNARARDSGFKQLVLTNTTEEETPADQVMGGPWPLYTNDGGSATVLDFQPNLKEWTDLTRERTLELGAKYGISAAEYKAEGAPQSGFAKKLDYDKVLKENRRTRKFFVEFEKELYKKTRALLEQSPVADIGTLPDDDLIIDFAEPNFTEDPKVQATVDAQRIKLNISSVVDVLKRENPDLSEKELVEMAAKNKRINEALVKGPQLKMIDFLAGLQDPNAAGGGGTPPPSGSIPPSNGELP